MQCRCINSKKNKFKSFLLFYTIRGNIFQIINCHTLAVKNSRGSKLHDTWFQLGMYRVIKTRCPDCDVKRKWKKSKEIFGMTLDGIHFWLHSYQFFFLEINTFFRTISSFRSIFWVNLVATKIKSFFVSKPWRNYWGTNIIRYSPFLRFH